MAIANIMNKLELTDDELMQLAYALHFTLRHDTWDRIQHYAYEGLEWRKLLDLHEQLQEKANAYPRFKEGKIVNHRWREYDSHTSKYEIVKRTRHYVWFKEVGDNEVYKRKINFHPLIGESAWIYATKLRP